MRLLRAAEREVVRAKLDPMYPAWMNATLGDEMKHFDGWTKRFRNIRTKLFSSERLQSWTTFGQTRGSRLCYDGLAQINSSRRLAQKKLRLVSNWGIGLSPKRSLATADATYNAHHSFQWLSRHIICEGLLPATNFARLPPSMVGDTYTQLLRMTDPDRNVVVGSPRQPLASQGGNSLIEQQLYAENQISAVPFRCGE